MTDFKINIVQDSQPGSPDDWANDDIFLVAFSNRHLWITRNGLTDPEQIENWAEEYDIFELYAYIHSGITLSLEPFSCPWDSGQYGYVLVKKGSCSSEIAQSSAQFLVDEWNMYLSGDVWGFDITGPNGKSIASCWGFYGRKYCEEEAQAQLEYFEKEHAEQSQDAPFITL